MENKQTLNFSITGEFITNFARDQWVSGEHKKAIELITTGLIGETNIDIAFKIILGTHKLIGTNDLEMVNDNTKIHSGIPLTIDNAWNQTVNKLKNVWLYLQSYYYPNRVNITDYVIKFKTLITSIKTLFDKLEYLSQISNNKFKTSDINFTDSIKFNRTDLDSFVIDAESILNEQENNVLIKPPKSLSMLDNYLKTSSELSNLTDLEPQINSYKYDAIWISRKGEVYGLNGEKANMLHIKMAEILARKDKRFNKDEDDAHHFLEQHGWMKISGIKNAWVLYDGFRYNIEPTSKQLTELYKFAGSNLLPYLKLGFKQQLISTAKIQICINEPYKTD